MSWFERITRGWARPGRDDAAPTPSSQWTVSGIGFATTGWTLVDSSPASMSWSAPDATLVLTRTPASGASAPIALVEYRNRQRILARSRGEDVVVIEIVPVRQGHVLSSVYKCPSGLGFRYRGVLEFNQETQQFRIESDIGEGGTTGIREAIVNATRASCGEFARGPQNPDGSYQVQGLLIDAYNPAFDQGALNSLSDDDRLDVLFPGHPLSRTRGLLATITASLDLHHDAGVSAAVLETAAIDGPRRQLSLRVVRSLFASFKRFDLLERSLKEELSTSGNTPNLDLATGLVQVGANYHLNGRPGNALPLLTRAESMFVRLLGDEAPPAVVARIHRGAALFKLGRRAEALPLLLRAIKVMESTPVDPAAYMLALATAAQILARQGDGERAAVYAERAKQLMEAVQRPPTSADAGGPRQTEPH